MLLTVTQDGAPVLNVKCFSLSVLWQALILSHPLVAVDSPLVRYRNVHRIVPIARAAEVIVATCVEEKVPACSAALRGSLRPIVRLACQNHGRLHSGLDKG